MYYYPALGVQIYLSFLLETESDYILQVAYYNLTVMVMNSTHIATSVLMNFWPYSLKTGSIGL